ncbi:MAG: membrane protein insertase YidC, partial [Acidobacteria bacterium]|nr:membrane protein insertase YidC [Acidobacteriota bacterium]
MEKRTVLAIVISIVFILIWQKMVMDKITPAKKTATAVSVEKTVKTEKPGHQPTDSVKSPVKPSDTGVSKENAAHPSMQSEEPVQSLTRDLPEEKVVLENQFLKLTFTNKGGRLISAKLKKYKDEHGNIMELVNPVMTARNLTPFAFEGKFKKLNTVGFQVEKTRNRVIFTCETGAGRLVKDFELLEGYQLKLSVHSGVSTPVRLTLGPGIDSAEKSHGRYSTEDTVVVFADDSVDRI